MKILVVLVICFSVFSCKSDSNTASQKQSEPVAAQKAQAPEFERIPDETIMRLWNECTLIDYIFHDLPFSMNQGEQASIRTNLTYIDGNVQANIPAGCKPMARQFYQIEGEIVYEADVYYSDNCKFYVFYDGDKKYANKMSNDGMQFFNTMISKALDARKQMGQ